jgi:3-deoxy-D-manno-octulosonate 8-phosphate phosphatase (KDO 8-P phosphatase)
MTATSDAAPLTAEDRARRIKVLIFDVDGVLTDGQLFFLPANGGRPGPDGSQHGLEVKGFTAHDGLGITLARLGGLRVGIITKRESATVAIRARDLKLEFVYQGQAHKLAAAQEIAQKAGVTMDELAYVGDDVVDLPVMRACGLAIATANARPNAKSAAHWVTPNPGGHGAGRDAIDFILAAQGKLDAAIAAFLDAENPAASASPTSPPARCNRMHHHRRLGWVIVCGSKRPAPSNFKLHRPHHLAGRA